MLLGGMLSGSWVPPGWCLVVFGLGIDGSNGVEYCWVIKWLIWYSWLLLGDT